MNIYRRQFSVKCPNNDESIWYSAEIRTSDFIMVEDIAKFTDQLGPNFHEAIADEMHRKFGGAQTIVATHHGVEIETRRG